jgi:hypothetical protein
MSQVAPFRRSAPRVADVDDPDLLALDAIVDRIGVTRNAERARVELGAVASEMGKSASSPMVDRMAVSTLRAALGLRTRM